jgi:SAM-dependent methyltransferase
MDRSPAEILVEQAAAYARGRPDYPPAIEGWLCGTLGLRAGKVAVDLGSGTGKFLPRLIATGADVTAIEPLAEMRAHLTALHPQIDAREGRAQALPLTDSSVDAVICAQSFHLFATAEALAEIRRVLKPDGALGLLWNLRDDSVPWVARIIDIMAVSMITTTLPMSGRTGAAPFPRRVSPRWRSRAFPIRRKVRPRPSSSTGSCR